MPLFDLRKHGHLYWSFARRELKFRFAGSVLGVTWTLIGPIALLSIISLVFGQLFTQRTELATESYTFYVALALWPWLMFADGAMRGMLAIQSNASIVKKIAFPHALLVVASVTAVFLQHLIAYIVIILLLIGGGSGSIKPAGIPVALFELLMLFGFTVGVALLLASFQTFFRDTEQAVVPVIMMLHYLTPILYPPSLIPPAYKWLLSYNPLAILVTRLRECLQTGASLQVADGQLLLIAATTLALGYMVFTRMSPHFEDFL